jgi:hypothetical protein
VPFALTVPESTKSDVLDLADDPIEDSSPEASSEEAIGVNKVPFAVTVPAFSIKLLPARATESLEVSDPEAERAAAPIFINDALGVNSAFDSIEELRGTKAVPFELMVPEPIILASEDRIKDTSDDNSPVASSEEAIGVNRVPFPVTVPASNNKLLPGAIIDPLEVNDTEAGRVARPPCITPIFESNVPEQDSSETPCFVAPPIDKSAVKLPEAFSVATLVLTSPTETADVEEKGFSLKLWKPNISSA